MKTATATHIKPPQKKELVFNRCEKKYLISCATAEALAEALGARLTPDARGSTTIRNLYLDTPDYLLIRRSIEKPLYKEKLRVRTYGTITGPEHEAFVEIKKKFDGQVSKRRLTLPLGQTESFIHGRLVLEGQIARELAWTFRQYEPLVPAMSVVYTRRAFTYPGLKDSVRITFDYDLVAKFGEKGDFYRSLNARTYRPLLPPGHCIMEIKSLSALPLELVDLLSEQEVYPVSFSKVGTAYQHLFCLS